MNVAVTALALLAVAAAATAAPAVTEGETAYAASSDVAAAREARTFGGPRKRLLLLLLPIVYKLGVISTLMGVLIALAVKAVVIGLLLLALGGANLAAVTKLKSHDPHGWSGGGYSGGVPIHLHVHGGGHGGYSGGHQQAYSAWEPSTVPHLQYENHPYRRR